MEINPNHPVTRAVSDHWHKICAVLLSKEGKKHVVITEDDIAKCHMAGLSIEAKPDGIHLKLITFEEATILGQKEGGLPI